MNIFDSIRHLLRLRRGLSCEDVNGFLSAYVDGALDETTRRRFEEHLRQCPNCDAYFEQYRATIDLVRESGRSTTPAPPPDLAEVTLAFLRRHWDDD